MVLSYEKVRKIHRMELNSIMLTPMEESFFDELKEIVEKEMKEISQERNIFEDKHIRKIYNLKRMVEDILFARQKKIINKAILHVKKQGELPENLTKIEEEMFHKLVNLFSNYINQTKDIFEYKEKKQHDTLKVTATTDIPKFIGTDMKEYGPFKANETIELPKTIAQLLLNRGLVKEA